ncbi:unnamed protein product, partial [Didymodactylos carnosus]
LCPLHNGQFQTCNKPETGTATWWNSFQRIQDDQQKIIPFVQCIKCKSILSYDAQKTESNSHKSHVETCKGGGVIPKITTHFKKDITANISMDLRRSATEACVKFCSYDMRPFDIMNGHGFQTLCQALLDAGHSQSHRIIALDILPDCTTIARSVNSLADKKRLEFIEMLKVDLKNAELFGITCDYWKNKYSCESYLTINMHYGKNGQIQNVMLKTMLFTASKTAENTWNAILATLNSYGIDSDKCHIIFITDSGANLVKAFKGEAHLRCVSHCINLTAQQAIESVPEIHQLQNECRTLVTHFKRCELQHLLDTTLKHDCEVSIHLSHKLFIAKRL